MGKTLAELDDAGDLLDTDQRLVLREIDGVLRPVRTTIDKDRAAIGGGEGGDGSGYDLEFTGSLIALSAEGAAVGTINHNVPGGTASMVALKDSNGRIKAGGGNAIVAGPNKTDPAMMGNAPVEATFRVSSADGKINLEKTLTIPVAVAAITLTDLVFTGLGFPKNAPAGYVAGQVTGRYNSGPYRYHSKLILVTDLTGNTPYAGGQWFIDQYGFLRCGETPITTDGNKTVFVMEATGGVKKVTQLSIPVWTVAVPSALALKTMAGASLANLTVDSGAVRGPQNSVAKITWTGNPTGDVITLAEGYDRGIDIEESSGRIYPYGKIIGGTETINFVVRNLLGQTSSPYAVTKILTEATKDAMPGYAVEIDPGFSTSVASAITATDFETGVTGVDYNGGGVRTTVQKVAVRTAHTISGSMKSQWAVRVIAAGSTMVVGLKDETLGTAINLMTGNDTHSLVWKPDGTVRFNNVNVLTGLTYGAGDFLNFKLNNATGALELAKNQAAWSTTIDISAMGAAKRAAAEIGDWGGHLVGYFGLNGLERDLESGYDEGISTGAALTPNVLRRITDKKTGASFRTRGFPTLGSSGGKTTIVMPAGARLRHLGPDVVTNIGTKPNASGGKQGAWWVGMAIKIVTRPTSGNMTLVEWFREGFSGNHGNLYVTSSGAIHGGGTPVSTPVGTPLNTWFQLIWTVNDNNWAAWINGTKLTGNGTDTQAFNLAIPDVMQIGALAASGAIEIGEFCSGLGALSDPQAASMRGLLWNDFNTPLNSGEDFTSTGPTVVDLRKYTKSEEHSDEFNAAKPSFKHPSAGKNGKWLPTMPVVQSQSLVDGNGGTQDNGLYASWDLYGNNPAMMEFFNPWCVMPNGDMRMYARRTPAELYNHIGGDNQPSLYGVSAKGGQFKGPRFWLWVGGMMTTELSSKASHRFTEIKVKYQNYKGQWPAEWGMPGELNGWPPEHDYLEIFSDKENGFGDLSGHLHTTMIPPATTRGPNFSNTNGDQDTYVWRRAYSLEPEGGEYVLIGFELTATKVNTYINSVLVGSRDRPRDYEVAFYNLSNMDVFATGAFASAPDASTPDFIHKQLDYFRTYLPKKPTYSVAGGNDADATAYIAALPSAPTTAQQVAIHAYVKARKAAIGFDVMRPTLSLWELSDYLVIPKFGLNPLKGGGTPVNTGNTFVAGTGLTGVAGGSFDTGFTPTLSGETARADDFFQAAFVSQLPTANTGQLASVGSANLGLSPTGGSQDIRWCGATYAATRGDAAVPTLPSSGLFWGSRHLGGSNVTGHNDRYLGLQSYRTSDRSLSGSIKLLADCPGARIQAYIFGRRLGDNAPGEEARLLNILLAA